MIRHARTFTFFAFALAAGACGHGAAPSPAAPSASGARSTGTGGAAVFDVPPQAAEIAAARGLDLRRPVAVNDVTRARFRRALRDEITSQEFDETLGDFWSAFGFVPLGTRIEREATLRSAAEQLLGLYVSRERAIYMRPRAVAEKTTTSADEVLVHELVHAVQDDHFGMAPLYQAGLADDEHLARRAVYEGDATVATWLVLGARAGKSREQTLSAHEYDAKAESLLAGSAQELEAPASAPMTPLASAMTYFPYTAGAFFMAEATRAGGADLVAKVFGHLPTTTEQVLHPEKYFAGEGAIPVATPAAPPGWAVVTHGSLGELRTRVLLSAKVPMERAIPASTGWGGDAYAVVRSVRSGRLAILWSVAWDDERTAARFATALDEATRCTGDDRACPLGPVAQKRVGAHVAWVRGLEDGASYLAPLLHLAGPTPRLVPPAGLVTLGAVEQDGDTVLPLTDPVVTIASLGLRMTVPEGFDRLRTEGEHQDVVLQERHRRGRATIAHMDGPFDAAKEASVRATFTALWASSFEIVPLETRDVELPIGRGRELRWSIDGGRGAIHVTLVPMCHGAQVLLLTRLARAEEPRVAIARWEQSVEPVGAGLAPICGNAAAP